MIVSSGYCEECSRLEILVGPIGSISPSKIDTSNILCNESATKMNSKRERGLPSFSPFLVENYLPVEPFKLMAKEVF